MVCILNMGSTSQIASHHTSAFVVAGMLEEHIYIFYHPRVESFLVQLDNYSTNLDMNHLPMGSIELL